MEYIYFLTIDKVKLSGKPKKKELISLRNQICTNSYLQPFKPYQVHCFEFKDKGINHGRYLHYHCLLRSKRSYIPYKEVKVNDYSVKLIKMKTSIDVAMTAGYIQKLKKDACDLEKIQKFLKMST